MASIRVQGIDINVIEAGTGEPVLFLHGNPDSAEVWTEVMAQMQQQFHCIAIDLPGFGESGAGNFFDMSLENLATFIDQVVDALELRSPLHLVVHDIGGPFGLAWMVRHPDRVKRVGILNTVFSPDYRWHFWGRVWRSPLIGELSWLLFNRPFFTWLMGQSNPQLTTEQIHRTYDNFDPPMQRMILKFYRAADPETFVGWDEDLKRVMQTVPACVIWGDRDPYIQPHFAETFGAQQVQHVQEGGHWLMLERPALVAESLSSFFQ